MLDFFDHPSFERERAALTRRFSEFENATDNLKRLFEVQFHPTEPRLVIGPGKIHCLKNYGTYALWKVEMSVKGLKNNQCPRVWFGVQGIKVAFLCVRTHIDNYDDNGVSDSAETRLNEIF
mgnify:CR=1 FL=1